MPKLLDRLVSQLQVKGMPKARAYAVANSTLQKAGDLKKGSEQLTVKGAARQAMGASGRAKSRAAKASGKPAAVFTYSSKTNRATRK